MNIVKAFALGQKGDNMGLPMGEGLEKISLAINHVQKARIYTVAAAPKGKIIFSFCCAYYIYMIYLQ